MTVLAPSQILRRSLAGDLLRIWLPAVVLLSLVFAGMGVLLLRSQSQAGVELEERYELRAMLSSRFVAAYVSELQQREAAYATEFLAGRTVTDDRFDVVAQAFGFDAALLLDDGGAVLRSRPHKPELIGTRLADDYAHLRAAVAGSPAISGVVPSAARAEPIVAFAVPFATPQGRRVFSGGVPIARSPLAAYLRNASPFAGARAYLVDGEGQVIVAGGAIDDARVPPAVTGTSGSVVLRDTAYRFASHRVNGTSWTLLTLAPTAELYAPITGLTRLVPWAMLLAFGLAAAVALALLAKLLRQKSALVHLAAHDPLTGTVNRRTLEQAFNRLRSNVGRSGSSVGVLAIDLDHFKEVNDIYGHAAGDELLQRVAETLQNTVRPSDVVARIGGDEFVILLADVDETQANEIAERVITSLDQVYFPVLGAVELGVRCSAGIALAGHDDPIADVLARADGALYEAKQVGRNTWRLAAATPL